MFILNYSNNAVIIKVNIIEEKISHMLFKAIPVFTDSSTIH